MANYALRFYGNDKHVELPSDVATTAPFEGLNFEIHLRVKKLSTGTRQTVLAARNGNDFAIELFNGGIRYTHYTGTGHSYLFYANASVDNWYDIKVVQTPTGRELWIDGVLEDSDSVTSLGSTEATGNLTIGYNPGATSNVFDGEIDYVMIVNNAYSSQSRNYQFNEGSGTTLADSNGNDLVGGVYLNPPAADAQWILLPSGLNTVSNSVSIDWNMLAEVSNGYQSLWNLLSSVSGQASFKWELLQSVLSNSELNWSLVESINNNVQFDWDLLAALAAVSNSTQAKWNLLSQISNDLDVEWDLLASVGASIQLNWDLLSALASVSRGVQLKWDMAGQVKAQLDAQWNLLEAVGVTTDLRWNLAVNVANQVQAQWDLLQGIKSNVDLVWDSIAATSNGLEFRWSLLSESVRIPIHVMLVLNEDRIMKILN